MPRVRTSNMFAAWIMAIAAILLLGATSAKADLRKSIAKQFGIEEGSFVLNFPPRPGCLPGSVFTDDLRFPISRTKGDDASLERGPAFSFTGDFALEADASASAGMSQWFGIAAKAATISNVKVEFKDARVVEILGPELKKRILKSDDARSSSARKVSPFVVARSYEGIITVKMSRKAGADAQAWATLKKDALEAKIGAKVGADDTVEFTVGEPFVFAFEVVRAAYVAEHMGPGADEVRLTPIPEDMFRR